MTQLHELHPKQTSVMATPNKPVGNECEFVDQVPEDYFCKQCKHVAREPQIASCCIEVFCKLVLKLSLRTRSHVLAVVKIKLAAFYIRNISPRSWL